MYLYIFMLFLTASLRNDALGGLTYIIPDDYYQLNAYDFGNLSAGLVMDDNGMSYVEGFYYVDRDSAYNNIYTTDRGYGHLRFNNNQKFAFDIKLNELRVNHLWLGPQPDEANNYKMHILGASAEMAAHINDKIIIGTGWENRNYKEGEENDFPPYSFSYSYNRMNGSFLYINNIFNIGSRIEYMNIKGDFYEIPYKRITTTLYSLIPITDNLRLAGRWDGLRDTTQYFRLKIRSEFTPMKEIIIGAEIKAANFDELNLFLLFPPYLYKKSNQSLTFGIGYKKDPVFFGMEDWIERNKWGSDGEYGYSSVIRVGGEIHKRGIYVRAGINANTEYNFSFGLGYNKDKLDIDYLYNYKKEGYWYDSSKGNTNAFSIRMKF